MVCVMTCTNNTGMYAVSDVFSTSSPVGAPYIIPLDIFSFSHGQRPELFSLSQGRQLFFDSFTVDLEIGSLRIVFNSATSLLNGESVVCFTSPAAESRRRKRIPTLGVRLCGDTFTINIVSK